MVMDFFVPLVLRQLVCLVVLFFARRDLTSAQLNVFWLFKVVLYCSYQLISFLLVFPLEDLTVFSVVTGSNSLMFIFIEVDSFLSSDYSGYSHKKCLSR